MQYSVRTNLVLLSHEEDHINIQHEQLFHMFVELSVAAPILYASRSKMLHSCQWEVWARGHHDFGCIKQALINSAYDPVRTNWDYIGRLISP